MNNKKKNKKKNKKSKATLVTIIICAVIIAAVVSVMVLNKFRVDLFMNGPQEIVLNYGDTYKEQGASAVYTADILSFIKQDVPVEISGNVNTESLGEYLVTYTARRGDIQVKATRKVMVEDLEAPVITLHEIPDYYTLPGEEYAEEGFTAVDNCDGDITSSVISEIKDGVVYYEVTDRAGNKAQAERKIIYDDREAPQITFANENLIIDAGGEMPEDYKAIDNLDGDITDKVEISGEVDTNIPGTYTLKYYATDSYGNTAVRTRTVEVVMTSYGSESAPVSGEKIVFLTFDDGPGPYTGYILDLLAKYKAKGTFFVTYRYPEYAELISREAEEGHTVAVHSYSHDYSEIYSSASAFWEDFNKMNDLIEEYTGRRSNIFRFPGGSDNEVSYEYSPGIMTELTQQALSWGLDYFDWNVNSGDAGTTEEAAEVAANVIAGLQYHDISVVLLHDIHPWTAESLEEILKWGTENGYTFLPLVKGMTVCHREVSN